MARFTKTFLIVLLFIFFHLFILIHIGTVHQVLTGSAPMWDFDNYVRTVREVVNNQNPYQSTHMQLSGPPLVLVPFLPFAPLPVPVARSLMLVLCLFALYLSSALLAHTYFAHTWKVAFGILSTLLLTAFPARFTLILGQPTLLLTLMFSLLLTTTSPRVKGILTAWLIVTKTYLAPMSLAFLRASRETLFWFIGILGSIVILSSLVIPPKFYAEYVQSHVRAYAFAPEPKPAEYYSQSLKATLSRFSLNAWYIPLWITAVSASALYIVWSGNLPFAIMASSLLSPILWQQNFVVFFPIYVLVWTKSIGRRRVLLLLSFFFWWIEFPWLHQAPQTWAVRLLTSHYFLSAMLLIGLLIFPHSPGNWAGKTASKRVE